MSKEPKREASQLILSFNLFFLKRELEIQNQRPYGWREIADKTGLDYHGLIRMSKNEQSRVSLNKLEALLNFFREEGMLVGPGDLFLTEEVP